MLFQVGGQGTRPTFFEMAAAQQLPSSLRAALTYSLGVCIRCLNFPLSFLQIFVLKNGYHSKKSINYNPLHAAASIFTRCFLSQSFHLWTLLINYFLSPFFLCEFV